jgi:hypothetical protein
VGVPTPLSRVITRILADAGDSLIPQMSETQVLNRRQRAARRVYRPFAGASLRGATGWPLALAVYLVTAIGLTWPLVLHIGSGLYLSPGRPYGDYTGTIATLHAMLSPFHFPFLPAHISAFNAPDGIPLNWGQNLTWLPYTIVSTILGLAFGARASFELVLLLSFVASGLSMYGLVRNVLGNRPIAILAGWAFAFYPYAVSNGEHPIYVSGWPFALMLWAIFRMLERPALQTGALAGWATLLAMAWTSYYLLLGGIAFAACVVACLLIAWREKRLRVLVRALVPACLIVIAWLVFVLGLSAVDPAAGAHEGNSISGVYQQSALPINYLLAPARNFLLGHFTGATIVRHGWVGTEKTLYLGDSLLALGLVAALAALGGRLRPVVRRATLVSAALVLGCAICSFAPSWRVFGTRIDLPSYFIFTDVTSGFRIYERFVIVIECGVCFLAAVGLWVIYDAVARRHAAMGIATAAVLAALIVCDLWAPIPNHFERLVPDHIFTILARQPPGAYADLPLEPADALSDYTPLFDQGFAGRPVVNGYGPATYDEYRDVSASNIALERSRATLQAMGVKYLLYELHPVYPYAAGPVPQHGVKLIAQDAFARLYRNTTPPTSLINAVSGFSYPGGPASRRYRWIAAPRAIVQVQAVCDRCTGLMTFDTATFGQPRTVTIRNAGTGALIATQRGTDLAWRLNLHFDRTLTLAITTTPGPQLSSVPTGTGGDLKVSVRFIQPIVRIDGEKLPGIW